MQKFLPLGVQDFGQMIDGNFVYVDKTRYVYEMVRIPQAYYFLARPRRFGKSLLVSTLRALFEGRKELFKGLWIENSDWPWQPHPVLLIDFNQIKLSDPKNFETSLLHGLDQIAERHGLALKQTLLPNKLVELIGVMHRHFQQKVVILVDEYDKPIITHLGQGEAALEIAKQNRALMKEFFSVLKGADVSNLLRMVFITGISKFSKVSIFSELNNLQDLSMQESFAGVLGYTQQELEQCLGEWIAEFARRRQMNESEIFLLLKDWYNGHRFTLDRLQVYNPFSIINALAQYKFKNFWFESGTPSFLANLIKEKNYPIPDIESLNVPDELFSTYEIENLQLEPLLFQTGYVTIHDFDGMLYRLGYPNQEVKVSFLSYLYQSLVPISSTVLKGQFVRLHQYLAQEELESFIATTNAILAAIPYTQIGAQGEHYYHTVFYLMLAASGVLVRSEVLTSLGRMDMAVEFKDKVFIVELKCDQPAEEALRQIRAKRYHEKYMESGRRIHLLGINFDTKQRAITDWQTEVVN